MKRLSSIPATRLNKKTPEERAQSFLRDHQSGSELRSPEQLKALLSLPRVYTSGTSRVTNKASEEEQNTREFIEEYKARMSERRGSRRVRSAEEAQTVPPSPMAAAKAPSSSPAAAMVKKSNKNLRLYTDSLVTSTQSQSLPNSPAAQAALTRLPSSIRSIFTASHTKKEPSKDDLKRWRSESIRGESLTPVSDRFLDAISRIKKHANSKESRAAAGRGV